VFQSGDDAAGTAEEKPDKSDISPVTMQPERLRRNRTNPTSAA